MTQLDSRYVRKPNFTHHMLIGVVLVDIVPEDLAKPVRKASKC